MKRPTNYQTKQRNDILAYILSRQEKHITAAQIIAHFRQIGSRIGRATIYRHLDKMTTDGLLRKYNMDDNAGACFQYTGQQPDCHHHLHLKCEECGVLMHVQCETMQEAGRHIRNQHTFQVNPLKTVLYGLCQHCLTGRSL